MCRQPLCHPHASTLPAPSTPSLSVSLSLCLSVSLSLSLSLSLHLSPLAAAGVRRTPRGRSGRAKQRRRASAAAGPAGPASPGARRPARTAAAAHAHGAHPLTRGPLFFTRPLPALAVPRPADARARRQQRPQRPQPRRPRPRPACAMVKDSYSSGRQMMGEGGWSDNKPQDHADTGEQPMPVRAAPDARAPAPWTPPPLPGSLLTRTPATSRCVALWRRRATPNTWPHARRPRACHGAAAQHSQHTAPTLCPQTARAAHRLVIGRGPRRLARRASAVVIHFICDCMMDPRGRYTSPSNPRER